MIPLLDCADDVPVLRTLAITQIPLQVEVFTARAVQPSIGCFVDIVRSQAGQEGVHGATMRIFRGAQEAIDGDVELPAEMSEAFRVVCDELLHWYAARTRAKDVLGSILVGAAL